MSRHAVRFAPWLVLLLLFIANRQPGVWKIAVPAAMLQLALVIAEIYAMSIATFLFDLIVVLAFALSALWLVSGRLTRRRGAGVAAMAAIWLMGAMSVFVVCWAGLPSAIFDVAMPLVASVVVIAIVVALAWARRRCRIAFTWRRFHKNLLLALTALFMLPAPLLILILVAQGAVMGDITFALSGLGIAIVTLAGSAIAIYLLVAVYLILTTRIPVLEQRFKSIFQFDQPELTVEPPTCAGIVPE